MVAGALAVIVADTDVLIDALKGAEPSLGTVRKLLEGAGLATTAVTAFELLAGARIEHEQQEVENLIGGMTVLPVDLEAARRGAEVHRALRASGLAIGAADRLIAGIVLAQGGRLLTRNEREFARVPGLAVQGP